jgi:NAD-dependent dihydropyrimidine dehydrogenase PreA subunit
MAHIVKFDLKLCNACKTCVDTCFVDVIGWDEVKNIPTARHLEDCQVCGVCEENCPTNAITVIPDWSSKYFPRILAENEFSRFNRR